MSTNLGQYVGALDAQLVADGINAAARNARALTEEAEVLANAGFFARAASLAVLSIEESGKSPILRRLALSKSDSEFKKAWKEYRSHTKKNAMWLMPELVAKGARSLDDFRPLFDESADHAAILDQVKQLGFYSDCLGNQHWSEPLDVIDEALAKSLLAIAKIFLAKRETTALEIELWIEHLGPSWGTSQRWSKNSLVKWADAMRQAGIEVGDMKSFVGLNEPGVTDL